jgi:hypothetical protein
MKRVSVLIKKKVGDEFECPVPCYMSPDAINFTDNRLDANVARETNKAISQKPMWSFGRQ